MTIRTVVIAAAGVGTRFLPATKAQPKETLPVVDRPMIQYVVEEAVLSGIEEVIVVTSRGKEGIQEYFGRSFELERFLENKGSQRIADEMRGISAQAEFRYVFQDEQRGLGHAVLTAEDAVGAEPFALILPDDIIQSEEPVLKQMIDVYERYDSNVVALERVPTADVPNYGMVEVSSVSDRIFRIEKMVEKPSVKDAPSDLGVVGRYIMFPSIFDALNNISPGSGGEIQLTDGLDLLLTQMPVYGYEFSGKRFDVGNPLGLLKASVELALSREDIGASFKEFLRGLNLGES